MTRFINADALFKYKFKSASERTDLSVEYMSGWNDSNEHISEKAPTVEAVPVRHGKWIDTKDGGICSMCKSGLKIYKKIRPLISFCPFCGAKMDGEQNED